MKSNVTFVDLTVYKNIAPLLFGYLQVYACKDPSIKDFYSFETYSTTVKSLPTKVLQELQKKDSFVFAFSCYMWNMGLVSYLIKTLQKDKPDSYFILGGPQAINSGDKHLNPINENVLVCNGEGERTFSNFLKELMKPKPNFSKVRGLTFFLHKKGVDTLFIIAYLD